ncbi:MAG: lipopolysaccharide biosynthesis protein [Lachnospiraceae bacterium]|nr:lipopolysaccharide biosynthesis protein [Lachnospiraceae bacterium]
MKKNVLWNTVGSVYYSFCQWVMTVAVVWLSADFVAAGTIGLAMTVTNSFATIAFFGMRNFQISDVTGVYSDEEYVMSRRVTAVFAFALCAGYLIFIKCSPREMICVLIYMLIRLIESAEDVYQGVFQKNDRFDIIGISFILRGTLQIGSFVATFAMTHDLVAAFSVMTVTNLAVMIFFDISRLKKIAGLGRVRWTPKIPVLLKECVLLVVYQFAVNSLATVVRVAIRDRLGTEVLGVYSSVASPTVIITLLGAVIFTPFLPEFARLYNDGESATFKKRVYKIIYIFVGCFILFTVGGILLGKLCLGLIYGDGVAEHADYLLPLVWSTFFFAALSLFGGLLVAMRKTLPLFSGAIAGLVCTYILSRPLIERFGANGGSYAQVIIEVLLTVFYLNVVTICINKKDLESGS